MHKRAAHGELEATEASEQALFEQQIEGEQQQQQVPRALQHKPPILGLPFFFLSLSVSALCSLALPLSLAFLFCLIHPSVKIISRPFGKRNCLTELFFFVLQAVTVDDTVLPLKHQCITFMKVKEEGKQEKDGVPTTVAVIAQDGAEQV